MVKNTVQSLKAENDKQKEKVEEVFAERSWDGIANTRVAGQG